MRHQYTITIALLAIITFLLESTSLDAFSSTTDPRLAFGGIIQSRQSKRINIGVVTELNLFSKELSTSTNNYNDGSSINHRHSATDWWYNVKSLSKSSILNDIKHPVICVFGWSVFVSLARKVFLRSTRDTLQTIASNMCISSAVHSFLVSSLGLLLVFRTNSAYQRFNEGRKIWEHIMSVSRNLSRLCQIYTPEIGHERKRRMMNLIASFSYLLRHHVRTACLCEDENVKDKYRVLLEGPSLQMIETRHEGAKESGGVTELRQSSSETGDVRTCWVDRRNTPWRLFDDNALQKVARARNRPLWVCDRMGQEIARIPFGDNFTSRERQHFLSQVEKLTDAIGQCERIHQTAVPLNYARHSLRSLTVWLFTLPFALVKDLGLLTGPAVAIVAWLMFGVYQIGYTIEDPFQGSLRLTTLCDQIKVDVLGADYDSDRRDSAFSHDELYNQKQQRQQPRGIKNDKNSIINDQDSYNFESFQATAMKTILLDVDIRHAVVPP